MVRDRQKLLGRFVVEITDGHQQEVRVNGEGSRVMFDYPYSHIVDPENGDTSEGWHRELRLFERRRGKARLRVRLRLA